MIMQSIKLILDRINKDLTSLEEVIHKKISIENSNNFKFKEDLEKNLSELTKQYESLDKIWVAEKN